MDKFKQFNSEICMAAQILLPIKNYFGLYFYRLKVKYKTWSIMGCLLVITTLACTDNLPNEVYADPDVFIVNKQEGLDLSNYKTFSLNDSLFVAYGDMDETKKTINASAPDFFRLYRDKMETMGYTEVSLKDKPDIGIIISRARDIIIGKGSPSVFYYNKYFGYPQYGDEGLAYPGAAEKYTIENEIWDIIAVDLKNAPKGKTLHVLFNQQIWTPYIRTTSLYSQQIERLFRESSFLKK
jgi:hypothetical protein